MPMQSIELWFWYIKSATSGKVVKSSWRMTEEEAKRYPGAQKVPGRPEVRTSDPDAPPNVIPGPYFGEGQG